MISSIHRRHRQASCQAGTAVGPMNAGVSDAAFGQFRGQLEYKATWYGTKVVVADRWFPSSKTCSGCGNINAALTLADRVYDCGACALVIDRDVNAAVNLARYGPLPPKAPPLPAAA